MIKIETLTIWQFVSKSLFGKSNREITRNF